MAPAHKSIAPRTRIHLVRHGETEWNLEGRLQGRKDSPLTAVGRRQTIRLADRLQSCNFDQVLCSSSGRTQETARLILEGRSLQPQPMDELQELGLGIWEGLCKQEIKRQAAENYWYFWHQPDLYIAPEGAESFRRFSQRVSRVFAEITEGYAGQEILVVTHLIFIRMLLIQLESRPLRELWRPPQLENCAHRIVEQQPDDSFKVSTGIMQQPLRSALSC